MNFHERFHHPLLIKILMEKQAIDVPYNFEKNEMQNKFLCDFNKIESSMDE